MPHLFGPSATDRHPLQILQPAGPTQCVVEAPNCPASVGDRPSATGEKARGTQYPDAVKILYGVVGEGMGHAIRSRVVLDHLLACGHEVTIMASSRAADYLARRYAQVRRIHGFHIIYEDNRVRKGKTLLSNAIAGTAALPKQVRSYFRLVEDFAPNAVISDFESWTYFYGKAHRLPIFSIDNMQALHRCRHPPELLKGIRRDFEMARALVKSKMLRCDHYIITSFFGAPVRKPNTTMVPPILRPEILSAQATTGDHVLVYQTAEGHDALPRALADWGIPCRVYGMRRKLTADVCEGTLTYRPFDEAQFIADLASARAVISGGGFTLLGECVYLKKPTLTIPVLGQVEQVLNSRYMEREGYGMAADHVGLEQLQRFEANLPRYAENLSRYYQEGNAQVFATLDALLDRVL